MTGPSAPVPLRGGRPTQLAEEACMFRALAVLLAAAVCAVLVVAGCHGPASAAVPQPYPNRPPATPATGLR
jgi:hypothetical protein